MARGRPPGLIEMQAPGGEISHARLPPEQMSRNRICTVGEMKCKYHRKKKKIKTENRERLEGRLSNALRLWQVPRSITTSILWSPTHPGQSRRLQPATITHLALWPMLSAFLEQHLKKIPK